MRWLSPDGIETAERVLCALEADLRSGRHDRMETFARDLAAALARLEKPGGDAVLSRLSMLRARAARIALLVQAAQAGLRDARSVLAAPQGFASYDAHGRAGQIAPARARIERRR
ncbi:hypothetical protein DZD18_05155 [Rhodobacteraceae bacterium W635]|uniref:hypothetical protein n=1 Tax=Nioella halotolerans TaxID=2303578 RepID=UPI000E3DECB1|nr:hypothetical protein DZD18_05155 [Rhodobacteraceae bacterium W635]